MLYLRDELMRRTCLAVLVTILLWARPCYAEDPPTKKLKVTLNDHTTHALDLDKKEDKANLDAWLSEGKVDHVEADRPVNPMALRWELGVYTIVIFVALFLILKAKAWGPILEGLRKREDTIRSAVEEAKIARAETQRLQLQYKAEMDAKFAEIPKIMEEARRDAEVLKEELRSQANKEIQTDRQRLRREIESARDQALKELWEQAAQLATLISAKVIGKSLSEEDHRRLIDESLEDLRGARPEGQTRF
jgi:F-type H+-transporting ATPase subunit b